MAGLSVAVTGTATFFGADLLQALEADRNVEHILALDSKPPKGPGPKTDWQKLDLIHPRAPETLTHELRSHGVDTLIHSATLTRPVHQGGWAHELEAIGTRHVLVAAEAASIRKLVLRSSMLCYGPLPSNPNYLPETAPLSGGHLSAFIADKIEVENQASRFAQKHPDCVVTVLRFGPLLGGNCDTMATHYLSQRFCPTLLGFDPVVQFMHEDDAIDATVAAIHRDVRGAINVAAPGVVTLQSAIRLAGSRPVPIPRGVLNRSIEALWASRLGQFPAGVIDLLKYVCVGDLRRMETELEFTPRLNAIATLQAFAAVRKVARAAA